MTNLSLLDPLLIAITKLVLLQWKFMWCLDKCGPQTIHVKMIGTSSFAIIPTGYHCGSHCNCSQYDPSTAAQPHVPEAFVRAQ